MKEIAGTLQDSGIITKPDFFVFIVGMSDKDKDIKPGDQIEGYRIDQVARTE